ncbi:MAG: dihydropteroate synthase, partial [Phycisphaeraceae bacterium]
MRGLTLDLDRPRIMAIVNVTPDSFSDAGRHETPDRALAYCERALADGAAMLDIGGESTRPGATRIDAAEQIRRVVPVVERLRATGIEVPISVDTTRATVARAAIEAGANAINDVSGGTEDPDMLALAAETGAGIVLMHRLRPPSEDRFSDRYRAQEAPDYGAGPGEVGDVVGVVMRALAEMVRRAKSAGIARERIVVDPGLGFGKTVAQNFALADALHTMMHEIGCEALSAASR